MNIKIRKLILVLMLQVIFLSAFADEIPIKLEKPKIDTHDVRSVQRGARTFATYCLICHSLEYVTHDRIAKAAGITPDKMPDKNKKWWFGAAPPDLSLIARVRSPSWLYTYLHVFYKDPKRPTTTNNLLVDNVNMPNPFIGIQGEQELIVDKNSLFSNKPFYIRKVPYYRVLDLTRAGSIPPDEFDKMMSDLVNFLVYASEPKKFARERLGIWVLPFIAILFLLIYLLKREYWKKIKK